MIATDNEYLQEASNVLYDLNADFNVRERCRNREEYYNVIRSFQSDLDMVKDALALTNQKLDQSKSELAQTSSELAHSKNALAQTSSELAHSKNALAQVNSELNQSKNALAQKDLEIEKLQAEIARLKSSQHADTDSV